MTRALRRPHIPASSTATALPGVVRPWPAVVALAILVVFTLVIARRLLDGSRPPCACFGSRSNRPLGAVHVVRNVALMALAAVAAVWA